MDTYERSVRVDTPFETVWDFHSTVDGLIALTPDWMNLEIDAVDGPDGAAKSAVLESGSVIKASVQPFGVGPRQRWTSEIVDRERNKGAAYFRDIMTDGPFAHWKHTHLFYADGDETIVRDHIEYELPGRSVGRLVGPLAIVGLGPMFRYRHNETKSLLE